MFQEMRISNSLGFLHPVNHDSYRKQTNIREEKQHPHVHMLRTGCILQEFWRVFQLLCIASYFSNNTHDVLHKQMKYWTAWLVDLSPSYILTTVSSPHFLLPKHDEHVAAYMESNCSIQVDTDIDILYTSFAIPS